MNILLLYSYAWKDFMAQLKTSSFAITKIPLPEIVLDNNTICAGFSPSLYILTLVVNRSACIYIDANGWGCGKDTHVGVAVHMIRGELDDHLQWPFKGVIKVQLINQKEGSHVEMDAVEEHCKCRYALCCALEGERSKSRWGQPKFIPHPGLYKPENDKEYLKNDAVWLL